MNDQKGIREELIYTELLYFYNNIVSFFFSVGVTVQLLETPEYS